MRKAQSAMEYLMTYGWAILIIAVVLGVLFQLGVFSGGSLTPRAQSGSCQVQRLAGQVSLEGQCQGQLPQYVAGFSQTSGGNVTVTFPSTVTLTTATVSFWFEPMNNGEFGNNCGTQNNWEYAVRGIRTGQTTSGFSIIIETCGAGDTPNPGADWSIGTPATNGWRITGRPLVTGSWNHFVGVFNGVFSTVYINGVVQAGPQSTLGNTIGAINVFQISGTNPLPNQGSNPVSGNLANVQLYNTSFSSSEVTGLYYEGVGGAPVRIQNLVGWWPLNGNTNDYSGNNNNGQVYNGVFFNGTWTSAYTPP